MKNLNYIFNRRAKRKTRYQSGFQHYDFVGSVSQWEINIHYWNVYAKGQNAEGRTQSGQ